MEKEILRLNNCLSLQLGDGHKPKRAQVVGSPLLRGIIILDSRDKMIVTLSQIILVNIGQYWCNQIILVNIGATKFRQIFLSLQCLLEQNSVLWNEVSRV